MLLRWVDIILTLVVLTVFDLQQGLIDRWHVHVRRLHKRVLRETEGEGGEATPGRLAIVALYPSNDSLPFTLNLLDALAVAGFWTLVVSTRRLSDDQLAQIAQRAHHIIERAPVGRDFGSYKMGLQWLEQHRLLADPEVLVLANDSMFYPKAFAAELQGMLARPTAWQSLFESYEIAHHAQSFFMLFRTAVLRSEAFWKFWRRYRPYSARVHMITAGEIGLSRALKRAGFLCEAAYSSLRVANALVENPIALSEFAELVPAADHVDVSTRQVLGSAIDLELELAAGPGPERELQGGPVLPAIRQDALADIGDPRRLLWQLWSFRAARQFEAGNPAHTSGLLCNRLFAAPIKRDICYRGWANIHQILQGATGFSHSETAAMERDLRTRGLGIRMMGLPRLLFDTGRI